MAARLLGILFLPKTNRPAYAQISAAAHLYPPCIWSCPPLERSRDGKIRQVEIEYQNFAENVKRRTTRGTREIVVIHPLDELGLIRELNVIAAEFV